MFVLVIQIKEMLKRAKAITSNFAWILDFTFKTNHLGMPLFRIMSPNKIGLGIFMICNNDNKSRHIGTTLYFTMKAIFGNMDFI